MKLIPVTEIEVVNIITSLKIKNASEYDCISNKILKYWANVISNPFTYICNSSLASGIYPDRCKYELIQPIYKKADKPNISNSRPKSLLLSLSQVLETLMFNRLNCLQVNKIVVPEQFGFKKGINIENTIFTLMDTVLTSLNQ
jgi:hypothetical protein